MYQHDNPFLNWFINHLGPLQTNECPGAQYVHFERLQTNIASRRAYESFIGNIGALWLSSKVLIVTVITPKYIGAIFVISGGWRTIISGTLNFTDALCLILNIGGNIGIVILHFTRTHCITASVLGYLMVMSHLLLIHCRRIPILSVRIKGLVDIGTNVKIRLGWEAAPPITPDSSAPTTIFASTTSSHTFTTSATITGVNARYLVIITAVKSLADKKLVVKMASRTGEIVMQSYVLDLGNAMVMIFSLGPLQEKYYFILDSPVIVPMGSQHGINGMLLHM